MIIAAATFATHSVAYAQTPMWFVKHDFGREGLRGIDSRDSLRSIVLLDGTLFVESRIKKTTDGGTTWRTVWEWINPGGYVGRLNSVSWVTDSLVIATADSGHVMRSTDGGESWDDRVVFDGNSTPTVHMLDDVYGFAFLEYVPEPRTFTTDDGGLTWEPITVPDPVGYDVTRWAWSNARPVRLSPSRFICIKEGRGNFRESRLLVTSDRGVTWDTVRSPFSGWEVFDPWVFDMRFVDSLTGWAAVRLTLDDSLPDWKWIVAATSDGGFTWREAFADTVKDRNGSPTIMWAGDSSRVILATDSHILRSLDGGRSWTYDSVQPPGTDRPRFAPFHPAGVLPTMGVHWLARTKLHRYGTPSATTAVDVNVDDPRGVRPQHPIRILDLRVDGSGIHTSFLASIRAPITITLYDLNGVLRYTRVIDDGTARDRQCHIETAGLPAGIYALRIMGDGAMDGRVIPVMRR